MLMKGNCLFYCLPSEQIRKDIEVFIFRQFYNTATGYKSNGLPSHHLNWGWASPSFQMKTSTSDLSKVSWLIFKFRSVEFFVWFYWLNIFNSNVKLMLEILNPGKSFIDEKMTKEMFKPGELRSLWMD